MLYDNEYNELIFRSLINILINRYIGYKKYV